MMISPEEFKNVVKDYSLDKLKQEKNRMEDYIKDYKNGKFNNSKEMSCPSPDIICKVYKRYIEVLNILIVEKEKQTYQDIYI